ncbi:MAG: homoserine kinase [Clostridia bacterium]|nr:homoserine kinase [Clostridia bacterium]MBQ2348524.1 homoserine kinase [Clostridia bacterium]MBQ5439462.1 homoserine kinase [Clostridia bacterium]
MIKIEIPATSANLGSGFDCLGVALNMYNHVWMEEADEIDITSKDDVVIPTDESNLIYWSAERLYSECGKKLPGLRIIQENNIPMTRGLGSSSACIVAGLVGANRFLGSPLTKHDLVNLACKIEGHPDNTTPALLGGLVTAAMENGHVYSVSVPVAKNIRFGVFIPPFELKTEVARKALPNEYSRENAVYNLSRSSLMTAALFSGSLENLRVAVQDSIHQPYRKKFISGVETVFRMSYELGSYGTYISGAGPSIIAIIDDKLEDTFNRYAIHHLESKGIKDWQFHLLTADDEGAKVYIE